MTTYRTIDADKIFRSFCPRWKHDVSKRLSFVIAAKVVTVAVGEHVRHVKELRNQLLNTAALNTHHSFTSSTHTAPASTVYMYEGQRGSNGSDKVFFILMARLCSSMPSLVLNSNFLK